MSDNNTTDTEQVTQLTKAANVDKPVDVVEFFKFLQVDLDDYSDFQISEKAAKRLKTHLMSLRTGSHAVVPLICAGAVKCPVGKRCPFAEWKADGTLDQANSNFPLLKACPWERRILNWKIEEYVTEFNVDHNSPSSISLISKLAELDMYEMRCDVQLSLEENASLLQAEVTSVNPATGSVYESMRIHPLWELKEKIHKQRKEILDSLLGTPKAKFQVAKALGQIEEQSGIAKDMGSLTSKMNDLLRNSVDVIDATYEESDEQDG